MTSDVMLRFYRSEDAPRCSFLMQDYFRNKANNLSTKVRTQIANSRTPDYVRKIATNRIIVVAVINERIVGMGALKKNEIRHMYVQSEHQQKGIGFKIIRFLEKEARQRGLSHIIVNSVDQSENFYIKNNFQIKCHSQIKRHGSVLEAILLEKILE